MSSTDQTPAAGVVDAVGLFVSDVRGRSVQVNTRWREILGLSAAEDPCEGWRQALHPGDRERVLHEWHSVVRANQPFQCRYRLRDPAGRITWVLGQGLVQRASDGAATSLVVAITATRAPKGEAEMPRRQERHGQAVDAVTWDWDVATGEIRWASDPKSFLGYGAGTFRTDRRGLAPLLHRDDRARVEERLRAHFEGRTRTLACIHRLRTRSGAWQWSLALATVIERSADGRPLRMVGFELDLSLQRAEWLGAMRTREQLRLLARRLALAEEAERQRIATGLHDKLGHGLALAKIKLGMLRQAEGAAGRAALAGEALGLLDEAIRETRSLTFELSPPVLHEVGLEPAIENLCDRLARESGIDFHCQTDPPPRLLAREQRVLLYRGVRELLHNVVKHARAHSAWVRVRRAAGEIRILVEDDGEGFEVAALAGPSDVSSGFGLFSLREGLEAVGGRLEIDSTPAKGTRIALIAPEEEEMADA